MAPAFKRKRGDRSYSQDEGSRPSPHRPGTLNLAQQSQAREQQDHRGRGQRRGNRGGRGGGGPPRSPNTGVNSMPMPPPRPNPPASNAMSPPASSAQQRREEPRQQSNSRPSTPTASTPSQLAQPKPSIFPYSFDYITEDKIASWNVSGRKLIVDDGIQARVDEDLLALGSLFQELLKSGLEGRTEPADTGTVIKEVLGEPNSSVEDSITDGTADTPSLFDPYSLFLDCLSILTESDVSNPRLKAIVTSTCVSPILMRQELSNSLLQSLGLIRGTFERIGIRQQTNLLYRQSNYNLLREETEGYSKLITELFTTSSNEPPTSEVVEDTFERVKALIGAFDLDVGRVLDVTLDVFAAVLVKQFRFFVKFLRTSSWWPQEKEFEGIGSFDQGFSTLPKWAMPGSTAWVNSEEDKDGLAELKQRRDLAFWERVRQTGMGAFFEIGRRRTAGMELEASLANGDGEVNADHGQDREWIIATGTIPPQGNRVAAQLLGFKLRFYASAARDANDILPVNLLYLAALLIKIGFISLRDLYPHLWPADEAMEAVKEEKYKEKAEKEKLNRPGGGTKNALMMAGALADDTLPAGGRLREPDGNRGTPAKLDATTEKLTPGAKADEKEPLPEPSDQKVQLLKSLLCIGAIPESLYMLGRFPWLPDVFPELPEHIHRILHHCLSKVYEPLRPLYEREHISSSRKIPDPDQSGVQKGQIRLIDAPVRKVLRWAQLDKEDTNEATDYRFYWDDWADNVPVCQTVDDVFLLSSTLLNFSGVKIGRDPVLLTKFARIGRDSIMKDASDANLARWVDLSKRLIVPALSFSRANPGVVNEVFDLIKGFSTNTRYSIYAEWNLGQISRLPDIKSAFDQAKAETKDVLKRISKTNVKPMARAMAKVAYASPGVVFSEAVSQIEAYDNLVEVVVECARYFTFLGYDVLTWSLMSSLGGKGRDRVQADGMLTSKWLGSLSLFAGKVFKRYSVMNPTPILQYVMEQLRKSNATELVVLKEITSSMAGIVSDANLNEAQVQAMAGGEILQSQMLLQLYDKRHESRITARRLMKSLTEPKLAGQLLIAIAQERQTCIYKMADSDAHVKLLGNLLDDIHGILAQYLDLLRSNLTIKEFDSLVPNCASLINDFGIEPRVAFWLSRPSILQKMTEANNESARDIQEQNKVGKTDPSGNDQDNDARVVEQKAESPEQATKAADETAEQIMPHANGITEETVTDLEMNDAPVTTDLLSNAPNAEVNGPDEPWHPVLKSLMDDIRPGLDEQGWESLSLPFYVTFWQLSLRDMLVPVPAYDAEINRQTRKIMALNNDRSDVTASAKEKKEKERKSLTELQERLRSELKGQVQAFNQTRSRLKKEKDRWFAGFRGKWEALNDGVIQDCLFPRLLLSQDDALYCFKMVKFLHNSATPNFRTLGLLDRIFREKQLLSLIFICTSREAENLGRFINELLKDLGRWHTDKTLFEKEAYGPGKAFPGFARKVSADNTPATLMDFEDFRRILYKWHKSINTALKTCLTGGEYMHIRNAIIVLKGIHQYFPAVNWIGQTQLATVTDLSKSETREDLKIAAASLLGNLKKREKEWMLPQAFNLVSAVFVGTSWASTDTNKIESAPNATNGSRVGSARPSTPQPDRSTKALNAVAPDFKPETESNTNGPVRLQAPTGKSSGKVEVEDGEIEDAKMVDASAKQSSAIAPSQFEVQKETFNTATTTAVAPALTAPTQPAVEKPSPSAPEITPARTEDRNPSLKDQFEDLKPTTPVPPPRHHVPSRPDLSRNPSADSAFTRPSHNLPGRPESYPSRLGDRRIADRPIEPAMDRSGDRRDDRDSRYPDHGRPDRSGELVRDHLQDRRGASPNRRMQERPPEWGAASDWERREPGWNDEREPLPRGPPEDRFNRPSVRDTRSSSRNADWSDPPSREMPPGNQSMGGARPTEVQDRSSRDSAMAPPRSNFPHHPDRAALFQAPSKEGPHHPDRAALINGDGDRWSEAARIARDDRRDRESRPQSPRRLDDRRALDSGPPPSRIDDRWEERPHYNDRHGSRDFELGDYSRYEESHPPTGPRGDRSARSSLAEPPSVDRSRELLHPTPLSLPPADPNHGRLNQDSMLTSRQQDPNYGRLNPGPDIPSGPRARNAAGRGGRNAGAAQPQINTRQLESTPQSQIPSPSIPDRQPPTGPSLGRTGGRSASQSDQPPSAPSSAPPTPATESAAPNLVGVHPDRLKSISGASSGASENIPSVHPDRMKSFQRTPDTPSYPKPTPLQSEQSALAQNHALSQGSSNAQMGSRVSNHPPASALGPPMNNRPPPTGPSSVNDRSRGVDKRFANIQGVLQQANTAAGPDRNDRGTSIRGRAGRPGNGNVPASAVSGPQPGVDVRPDFAGGRPDLFAGRPNGFDTPQAEDDRSLSRSGGRHESGREGERRSGRHNKTSRSHSRDRDHSRREEERPPRREEYRERRGGGGGNRDDRDNSRRTRDEGKERERRDGGRDLREEPDRRPPPPQEDGRMWGGARKSGGGGGGGGGAERGDGEWRDEREREPRRDGGSGRKRGRGGEEGAGERGPYVDNKRPRRTG
ncbi:MAG: THO complex subunit 2 [Pycnora praestabilis]|nr:MAG: THO complex subunit 2 [Pycnora praestabilis]